MNNLKNFVLMTVLMGLLVVAGHAITQNMTGVYVALGFSLLMNFGVYRFSDRIALGMLEGGAVANLFPSHPGAHKANQADETIMIQERLDC